VANRAAASSANAEATTITGPYHAGIDALEDTSIIAWWPLRALLLVVAAAAVVVAARALARSTSLATRILTSGAAVFLALVSVVGAINAYYAYYPTLGDALGDPSGESSLRKAEREAGLVPARGTVVPITIPGTVSGFQARQAQAYLPPAWFAEPRPALPVIMLMHGEPGDPSDWTDGGQASATADAWASAHRGVAPVLVMPDINGSLTADTECVDSPLGNAETYLTVDVPAAVQQRLGTTPPGQGWAVAGLSEGGACAIMLALRHPELFPTFGDFGGLLGPRLGETNADTDSTVAQLFGGSQQAFAAHEPTDLLNAGNPAYRRLGGWFEAGSADPEPLAAAQQLAPLAQRAGISTCLVVVQGGEHTFDVWSAAFRGSLPWMAARLGLLPGTADLTGSCQNPA
jgi:S-formylglutathione hydrolase FrmB